MTDASYELPQALLAQAGYSVDPDPDQPGLFAWTRREKGELTGGCDTSFDSAEDAWSEVREIVEEVLRDEAFLSAAQWNALSESARQAVIIEQFA